MADRVISAARRLARAGEAVRVPESRVAVAGRGMLATAIGEAVPADVATFLVSSSVVELLDRADGPLHGALLVTASDAWDTRDDDRIQALCAARRVAWLPVRTEIGRVVIGPGYRAGVAGCARCVEHRRSAADDRYDLRRSARERYPRLAEQPSAGLTALTARTVAALAAEEVSRWVRGQPGRTTGALLSVDLDTLAVRTHRFLPDPRCPACGGLPADSSVAACIDLQPRPKPARDRHRVRPLGEADLADLRASYVDIEAGLVRRVDTFASGSLAVGAAEMRTSGQGRKELSWGRTLRYRTTELVALLEALERYGGMVPGGRSPVVQASFAEVGDTALDPRTLGLYPPDAYAQPGLHFEPFDEQRVCRWVWGYSFARQEPILVPLAYAYYRAHAVDPDEPSFAYEISNGCALGACLEEAILYGILEVVERDAFLLTWYAQLAAARIDLTSARDRSIPLLAAAIEADAGVRVLAFDITMEHGIPSVWAMAVSPPGAGQPALACAAGAHLDPEQAAGGALRELGPILIDLIERYADNLERTGMMADDPSLVSTMDDHSMLYTNHAVAHRLGFLLAGRQSTTFADLDLRYRIDAFRHDDLTDDLTEMIDRLRRHGLDVVVVDQTTPEHRVGGLCCVKVIIPGTLSMTFGHRNRRTHGLARLFEVPRILGYRNDRLPPQDVNPHPHPFP